MEVGAVIAIAVAVIGAVGQIVLQALHMYLSYKRDTAIKKGIDDNTKLTVAGTSAASENAANAVSVAAEAKEAAAETKEVVIRKLNGGIDDATAKIMGAIEHHARRLDEHTANDERNMKVIDAKFEELTQYVHKRNHDLLDALGVISNKVEYLLPPEAKG